jgi:hypothetical protein
MDPKQFKKAVVAARKIAEGQVTAAETMPFMHWLTQQGRLQGPAGQLFVQATVGSGEIPPSLTARFSAGDLERVVQTWPRVISAIKGGGDFSKVNSWLKATGKAGARPAPAKPKPRPKATSKKKTAPKISESKPKPKTKPKTTTKPKPRTKPKPKATSRKKTAPKPKATSKKKTAPKPKKWELESNRASVRTPKGWRRSAWVDPKRPGQVYFTKKRADGGTAVIFGFGPQRSHSWDWVYGKPPEARLRRRYRGPHPHFVDAAKAALGGSGGTKPLTQPKPRTKAPVKTTARAEAKKRQAVVDMAVELTLSEAARRGLLPKRGETKKLQLELFFEKE